MNVDIRHVTREQMIFAANRCNVFAVIKKVQGRGNSWKVTIHPKFSTPETDRFFIDASGERKEIPLHCCWHTHRDFIRVLYSLAPTAIVRSPIARYRNKEDFERNYLKSKKTGTVCYCGDPE